MNATLLRYARIALGATLLSLAFSILAFATYTISQVCSITADPVWPNISLVLLIVLVAILTPWVAAAWVLRVSRAHYLVWSLRTGGASCFIVAGALVLDRIIPLFDPSVRTEEPLAPFLLRDVFLAAPVAIGIVAGTLAVGAAAWVFANHVAKAHPADGN